MKKLESIYRKLQVRFPYPEIWWNKIFSIPTDDLVEVFVERARQVDIEVEMFNNPGQIRKRINELFELYRDIWFDRTLMKSKLVAEFVSKSNQWQAKAGITACRALIARTGSIVVDSSIGRQAGLIAPVHFVVATKSQIYPDLKDFFEEISLQDEMPSSISVITGPSRTADIEKKLVKGAHGPAQITVLLLA